jgi:hypothetical protein
MGADLPRQAHVLILIKTNDYNNISMNSFASGTKIASFRRV